VRFAGERKDAINIYYAALRRKKTKGFQQVLYATAFYNELFYKKIF